MTSTERNNMCGGYAGVKDAEVNKSLPTQGGGAGDRETVAHHLSLLFYGAVGCQALYSDTTERMAAMNAAVTRTTDAILSALQAAPSEGVSSPYGEFTPITVRSYSMPAPSEGGEPVAWRIRQLHHTIDGPITGWSYSDRKPHEPTVHRYEVQALYAARPPAPSEEPLVGWRPTAQEIADCREAIEEMRDDTKPEFLAWLEKVCDHFDPPAPDAIRKDQP